MFQNPVIAGSTQDATAKLGELRAKAGEIKLRISDLETRRNQLGEQRSRLPADADRSALDKQFGELQHEMTATSIQLENVNHQIEELQVERDMARAFNLQHPPAAPIAITAPPPPGDPLLGSDEIITIWAGSVMLLFPFAIVMARRLWLRGSGRHVRELEDSPRLQRIEQAVESIALEVERIGEAQRFTTKLLAERQPDAVARMAPVNRREPGTITPH